MRRGPGDLPAAVDPAYDANMGVFDEWLTGVLSDPLGRLWYSHIRYERDRGRLTDGAWNAFQQAVSNQLKPGPIPPTVTDRPLNLVEDIVRVHQDELCCQGPPASSPVVRFSRVVNAFSFRYNLTPSAIGNMAEENVMVGRIWKLLDRPDATDDFTGWMQGWMDGPLNHFWIAPTDAIEAVLAAGGSAASVRDLLGLGSYDVDVWLLRIDIPASRIAESKVRIPTRLDAGTYRYYMPSDDPKHGWTLHLETLNPGAPELVIERIPFTREYQYEKLGRIDRPCPAIDWADLTARYEARCP